MRRIYTPWLFAVGLAAAVCGGFQGWTEERHLTAEESARAEALAASLEEPLLAAVRARRFDQAARLFERLKSSEKLVGAALCVYDPSNSPLDGLSRGFPVNFAFRPVCSTWRGLALARTTEGAPDPIYLSASGSRVIQYLFHRLKIDPEHGQDVLATRPNEHGQDVLATQSTVLVLARDASAIREGVISAFLRTFLPVLVTGLGLCALAALQIRKRLRRSLRPERGQDVHATKSNERGQDVHATTQSKVQPAASTPDSARSPLFRAIARKKLVVIANREPYIHERRGNRVALVRPASGLVTALDPILRQCGGLWIAHGSGSADLESAGENGEIAVPPEDPAYTLKRVGLTREEESGYYYGFSNEGLWPLCHLAHTRPTFRLTDWKDYVQVNRKFSESVPDRALGPSSLVLVQDYHFALLPRLLKARAPSQPPKISLFWHIPWPNPETFGICPWGQELLRGMLGADVIGFHTQYHCNNFLEACNRYLEARIDYERFSVTMENHETLVRAFPIGIDTSPVRTLSDGEIAELKARYGIRARFVAVGVDRIDYTKGIVERCEAVECFLDKNPALVGQFTLVQMGSPSRTQIPAYRDLHERVVSTVARVNGRFGNVASGYQPIVFLPEHHEWNDIRYFYQMGDICLVTSLHDGMNLVAKEYVWCQKPMRGSLVLSKFTGASRELTEALIVNPYSTEEMADAIALALSQSPEEKALKMNAMREKVRTRNAYQWASELIETLVKKREDPWIRPIHHVAFPKGWRDQRDRWPSEARYGA